MLHASDMLIRMQPNGLILLIVGGLLASPAWAVDDIFISHGRSPDSTAKVLSEIHEADQRRIPIEAAIKARSQYKIGNPIPLTVTISNLFDPPLLINGRLLVNHRLLPGELSFSIVDPQGKKCEFNRLISPMDLKSEDFVLLSRGMSVQRTVDLADFFRMEKKRGI